MYLLFPTIPPNGILFFVQWAVLWNIYEKKGNFVVILREKYYLCIHISTKQ